jgi:peptidoglycan/xylan/chitin deacetylase (PgdA/CDA1 family)
MRAILTYHSVDASGSPISIDPNAFRRHAEWLGAEHVKVLSVEELLSAGAGTDAVALTFDDAFENFATVAWPLLRERGLPATVFAVADRVGYDNDWDGPQPGIPTLPLMDWPALARLREEGVTIGSHTRSHRRLTELGGDAIEDELAGSAEKIESETGERPRGLAYPYGSADERAATCARGLYQWACTTDLRPLGQADSLYLLPRLDMYYFRERGRLEQWGSGAFRKRIWLRANARRLRRKLKVRGV